MYLWDGRIRFSEVGEDKHLTLDGIVNYFQDCSTFQSEDGGNGLEALEALHRVWVLSSWQIEVKEYPRLGEKITTGTWPYEFHGFVGGRNFMMYGEDGRVLAYANSVWSYLNSETGRPVRIDDRAAKLYPIEPRYEMEYANRKIALPEEMKAEPGFTVEVHHLDANHHVNNGQYVKMAEAYLPRGFEISRMRAEYKKSALLGDRICPMICEEGNRVTVSLNDESGNGYCVVEFLKR